MPKYVENRMLNYEKVDAFYSIAMPMNQTEIIKGLQSYEICVLLVYRIHNFVFIAGIFRELVEIKMLVI